VGHDDLLAPVVGPVLGGWLCDRTRGPDVPDQRTLALLFGVLAWVLLKRHEPAASPVDKVGMPLTSDGGAAVMLDEGKDLDWFSRPKFACSPSLPRSGSSLS
jgi:DHA2 family multidrug resistance protein